MVPGSALPGRLPCAARASGLAHNSLHSLRSFRSNRRAKSELEARGYARAPSRCAAQPSTNRPAATRTAGRLHRDRCAPRRWHTPNSEVARPDDGRFVRGRERSEAAQARMKCALQALTRCHLFDQSERSERREFGAAEPRSEQRGQSARRADPGTMSTAAGRATAARTPCHRGSALCRKPTQSLRSTDDALPVDGRSEGALSQAFSGLSFPACREQWRHGQ
jgi:hypothetical protein